jgi:hypothetical protein
MEHRGIRYEVKKGIGKNEWVWLIHTPKLKQGKIAGDRDRAVDTLAIANRRYHKVLVGWRLWDKKSKGVNAGFRRPRWQGACPSRVLDFYASSGNRTAQEVFSYCAD